MGRKITEIYQKYHIMHNLQMHMLRVAAVASLICDNFDASLPKDEIIAACLLHDMGNIVKSNFEFMPEFLQPQGKEYWQKIKDDYIQKYGKDDHQATMNIVKEIDLSGKISKRIDALRFHLLCEHRDNKDFATKILNYADGRADPHGIVSYHDRMEEAKVRYKGREDLFPVTDREKMINCGKEIEKQIFARCKIKPEDINNSTVAPVMEQLRNFVIHSTSLGSQ